MSCLSLIPHLYTGCPLPRRPLPVFISLTTLHNSACAPPSGKHSPNLQAELVNTFSELPPAWLLNQFYPLPGCTGPQATRGRGCALRIVVHTPVPSSRNQHTVDVQKVFDEYERRKARTLLMKKLRPRDEMRLAQGQWQSSDQNPDCLIPARSILNRVGLLLFKSMAVGSRGVSSSPWM